MELSEYERYILFDMNGDGIPELHYRDGGIIYMIFSYYEQQVYLWYDGINYEKPLNNGAILYYRIGGAPNHDYYKYTVLDFFGNPEPAIVFSRWDANQNHEYDEDDH